MTDARKLFEELQQVLESNVKELEELRALKERLNEISSQNACNIVKLNVGGTLFSTSSKTLAEIPNSLLAGMVGQAVPVQTQADGSIFIDRSPQYFSYILDFYRKKGAVNVSRLRPDEIEDLLEEATYFNLTDFVKILSGKSEAPLANTSIPQVPPPPSATINFMTDATLAAAAAAPPAPSSSFERSASPLVAPSEILGSDSASSSPIVTQRRPATLMRNGAPRPNGMAAAPLAAPSASGSFYPDNYNPQEASAPFKTLRPSTDFAAPKPPESMLPPTTGAVAGGIALGAQSGYPNAPPAPQPSSSSSPGMYNLPASSGSGAILPPPPGYGVAAKPSYQAAPPPPPSYTDTSAMYGAGNLPPPPAYASAVPLMKKQQMPPPPPPGAAAPPPMYGAGGNLPPPPAYASAVPSMKQQQPPPPAYGSGMMMGPRRGAPNPYGMGMGMGMGRGPMEQKAIWKCDMNPNITIQGNMVLKAPKKMSAIVYSPLKTFSRGNHTFTVEIDYSDGKASIGVITKAALNKFMAKFGSLNPIQQTREMEKYKFIGMDEEEWGIQEEAYFYNSGTRYDTNQASWRKGTHVTYNIRIDADIGMVEFARGDNRWSQTISRSEVVFIVLAADGVSYSITG